MSRRRLCAVLCLTALAGLSAFTAGVSPAGAVDAGQLTDEFSRNQAGFTERYKGRTLSAVLPTPSRSNPTAPDCDPGQASN
jgi:hypothetical protein